MKIDTEISHVTKPGANLFRELGFSAEEAKRLQAASRKQINQNDTPQGAVDVGAGQMDRTASPEASRGGDDTDGVSATASP